MTAFSQKGIRIITTDSTIQLPKVVAIQVVKDIIKKDSCEIELTYMKRNIQLLKDNNSLKDSIIESKDTQIFLQKEKEVNYNSMLNIKNKQMQNTQRLFNAVNKKLKKANRKLAALKVTSTVITATLVYFILK